MVNFFYLTKPGILLAPLILVREQRIFHHRDTESTESIQEEIFHVHVAGIILKIFFPRFFSVISVSLWFNFFVFEPQRHEEKKEGIEKYPFKVFVPLWFTFLPKAFNSFLSQGWMPTIRLSPKTPTRGRQAKPKPSGKTDGFHHHPP